MDTDVNETDDADEIDDDFITCVYCNNLATRETPWSGVYICDSEECFQSLSENELAGDCRDLDQAENVRNEYVRKIHS